MCVAMLAPEWTALRITKLMGGSTDAICKTFHNCFTQLLSHGHGESIRILLFLLVRNRQHS